MLDTKFYKEALKGRGAVAKANSEHLYQVFTYVYNRAAAHGNQPAHEGMLLYPVVQEPFAFDYRIGGSGFRCGPSTWGSRGGGYPRTWWCC